MAKRKERCPYCTFRDVKDKVISHIERKHSELIPEGYTAARVLFNYINKKDHGTCIVCGRETPWDDKINKYKRLCGRQVCKDKLREKYKKNMVKVFGTYNILNDEEQQKKMLANRSISGEYRFKDGTKFSYVGSYEKKFLEFLDQVLDFDGYDIMAPGPTFEYEFEGKTHKWITDFMIIPYNLVIDVKDGGDNPNNRTMVKYRNKQKAKETMITTAQGKYSYLRLTDNQFGQLLEIFLALKERMDDPDNSGKPLFRINESVEVITEEFDFDSIKNEIGSKINEVMPLIYKDNQQQEQPQQPAQPEEQPQQQEPSSEGFKFD